MNPEKNEFEAETPNMPVAWDRFEVGEEIQIKNHIYAVFEIQKNLISFKPLRPAAIETMYEIGISLETLKEELDLLKEQMKGYRGIIAIPKPDEINKFSKISD